MMPEIFCDDILTTSRVALNSVDLIVTSPPYNVDISYQSTTDNLTYADYLTFSERWLQRCLSFARTEARLVLNIPLDTNKGGQRPVGADLTTLAQSVGWKYQSTIVWNEGGISCRTAWGSFKSASAPYVIAPVELIVVLYKDQWKKTHGSKVNDITKDEFIKWTNGVWSFPGEKKKRAGGHPAAFPIELPIRCIKLFSFVGDVVFDPFLGSGTTLAAAYQCGRPGIGIDISPAYCQIARDRLHTLSAANLWTEIP